MDARHHQPNAGSTTTTTTTPGGDAAPPADLNGSTEERTRVKLTVVGDGTVGKTCLLYAYVNKRCHSEEYIPTVFENSSLELVVDGEPVQLSLWDTAGQEEYCRLRRLIYPSTDIFLLCYAVDNPSSFDNITIKWWPELRHYCPAAPILLVATKTDLREDSELTHAAGMVDSAQGRRLKKKLKAADFLECSAKSYVGVQQVFDSAVKTVLKTSVGRGRRRSARERLGRWCRVV